MALTNHGRHGLFSFLSSLPISVLRNLELEANILYDRANKLYKAALLTRCYVQPFLSPYIDSEVNHKRHFIKIPFTNKGIEFIDLHSIFKDNLVISSIPNYFKNSETPIICYKYSKPIHTGQCKRTGGCYNELVVAFFSTGGGVKGKKIYTC